MAAGAAGVQSRMNTRLVRICGERVHEGAGGGWGFAAHNMRSTAQLPALTSTHLLQVAQVGAVVLLRLQRVADGRRVHRHLALPVVPAWPLACGGAGGARLGGLLSAVAGAAAAAINGPRSCCILRQPGPLRYRHPPGTASSSMTATLGYSAASSAALTTAAGRRADRKQGGEGRAGVGRARSAAPRRPRLQG